MRPWPTRRTAGSLAPAVRDRDRDRRDRRLPLRPLRPGDLRLHLERVLRLVPRAVQAGPQQRSGLCRAQARHAPDPRARARDAAAPRAPADAVHHRGDLAAGRAAGRCRGQHPHGPAVSGARPRAAGRQRGGRDGLGDAVRPRGAAHPRRDEHPARQAAAGAARAHERAGPRVARCQPAVPRFPLAPGVGDGAAGGRRGPGIGHHAGRRDEGAHPPGRADRQGRGDRSGWRRRSAG